MTSINKKTGPQKEENKSKDDRRPTGGPGIVEMEDYLSDYINGIENPHSCGRLNGKGKKKPSYVSRRGRVNVAYRSAPEQKAAPNAREKKSGRARKMEHQMDVTTAEVTSILTDLKPVLATHPCLKTEKGQDTFDELISEFESLVLLYITLTGCVTPEAIAASILSYVKRFFKKSLFGVASEYIKKLLAIPYVTAIAQDVAEGETTEVDNGVKTKVLALENQMDGIEIRDWVSFLKLLKSHWGLVKKNALYENFSKLLGLLVVGCICKADDIPVSIASFLEIENQVTELQKSSWSIGGCVLDVAIYFIENVSASWKTGSIMPLITGSPETGDIDTEIATVKAHWNLFENGNLTKITGQNDNDYYARLNDLSIRLTALSKETHAMNKAIINRELNTIIGYIAKFKVCKVNSGFRKAPFCIEYAGESAVGKSTIMEAFTTYMCKTQDIGYNDGVKYTLKPGASHWDGCKSDVVEIVFDDMGNKKAAFEKNPQTEQLIQVCNNVPFSPPMAHLENKGQVWIEPEIVSITTNVKNLNAGTYSNCPHSIQRRPHYVLSVSVKDEFRATTPSGKASLAIDTGKVGAVYGDELPLIPDTWRITVDQAVACGIKEVSKYETVKWKDVELKDVPAKVVINFLAEEFDKHRKYQTMLYNNRSIHVKDKKCSQSGCCQLAKYCMEHPNSTFFEATKKQQKERKVGKSTVLYVYDTATKGLKSALKTVSWGDKKQEEKETEEEPSSPLMESDSDDESDAHTEQDVIDDDDDEDSATKEAMAAIEAEANKAFLEQQAVIYKAEAKAKWKMKPKKLEKQMDIESVVCFMFSGGIWHNFFKSSALNLLGSWTYFFNSFSKSLISVWDWWWFVPSCMLDNKFFMAFAAFCDRKKLARWLAWRICVVVTFFCGIMYLIYHSELGLFTKFVAFTAIAWTMNHVLRLLPGRVKSVYLAACRKSNSIGEVEMQVRDQRLTAIMQLSIVLAVAYPLTIAMRAYMRSVNERANKEDDKSEVKDQYTLWSGWKTNPKKADTKKTESTKKDEIPEEVSLITSCSGSAFAEMTRQGNLQPESKEDVAERDAEVNVWAQVQRTPLPLQPASNTTSVDILQSQCIKNTSRAMLDDETEFTLFYLTTNLVVVPHHYFEIKGNDLRMTVISKGLDVVGGSYKAYISKAHSYRVPGQDLCLCYIAEGGSKVNLTKHLVAGEVAQAFVKILHKDSSGEVMPLSGYGKREKIVVDYEYEALTYKLDGETFKGLCGAPVILKASKSAICGIHVAGDPKNRTMGCCASLTKEIYDAAMKYLKTIPGILFTGSENTFETQIYGVDIMRLNEETSPKSPVCYLPKGSQLKYYGPCIGKSKFKTRVRTLPISEHVERICDKPNVYGGPYHRHSWEAYQKTMAQLSEPGIAFDAKLFHKAVTDYMRDVSPLAKLDPAQPLTDYENINGVDGKRFIDAINKKTSIGFPLSGPKKEFMLELEDEPEKFTFTPEIFTEIEKCEEMYAKGMRAGTIAKACKKDEVLPLELGKCRIFFGNPIVLVYLIRKYFLPIARQMQISPLLSECAVGINCHGPEWDDLHRWLLHFTNEEDTENAIGIIAGDYSKYDQKIPAQMIIGALYILIQMAKLNKYSQKDITIMEAMVADIVYAYISFDGDLVSLTSGGHISGNSLTVVINSIVGSLNMRCAFFSKYPDCRRFKDAVRLITYGDDSAGTVKEEYREFNIKYINEFLGKHGQTYTMPDKKSKLSEWIHPDDFDFLKRKSVYHPALDCSIGALDEDSCFKMLHCHVRDNLEGLEASAINIDTALSEWFNHGEDVYELRRQQMIQVAEAAGVNFACRTLHLTYQDRVKDWMEKYRPAEAAMGELDSL